MSSAAQSLATFDIATFQPPAGWQRQEKEGVVIFNTSNQQKGTYALITLYRSDVSSGDAKRDFDSDWQQFIVGQFGINGNPQLEPTRSAGGWEIVAGGTQFEKDLGPSVVILNTFSGSGTKFSFAALFNNQEYVPVIEAFISSVNLKKTKTLSPPIQTDSNSNTSIVGTWGKSAGAHMTYGDPVAAGMAGYTKDQYTFNANGTYSFVSKTFRMSYNKILLIIENGTYKVAADTITITPHKSVIQAWSKLNNVDKWGALLSTQNRTLETVTYRVTKHYFSGLQLWNLVLQADRPTERDGPFSNNTTFSNAWYYAPLSANNPVIQLP